MPDRSVIPWGPMLALGLILVIAGFTNRFGAVLAAFLAPGELAEASSAGSAVPTA